MLPGEALIESSLRCIEKFKKLNSQKGNKNEYFNNE